MTLVVPVSSSLASLQDVEDCCQAIEAWSERCESVPELRDATNKLAAIDEYLARTSTEGRTRVAAAMRRLEVRIGQLLPKAEPTAGPGRGKASVMDDGLSRDQRHDFRLMAENEDVVEDVIAESTDEAPASRRKVMRRIKEVSRARMERVRRAMSAQPHSDEGEEELLATEPTVRLMRGMRRSPRLSADAMAHRAVDQAASAVSAFAAVSWTEVSLSERDSLLTELGALRRVLTQTINQLKEGAK